jgi:hypothetical protein
VAVQVVVPVVRPLQHQENFCHVKC